MKPGNWKPGNFRGGRPAEAARSTPDSTRRMRRATSGGSRDSLSAAVLAGLVRWPDEISRHAESLARLTPFDPRFGVLLDALDSGAVLESRQLTTILIGHGMVSPAPAEYADFRFSFLSLDAQPLQAASELAQAIGLLVERPALELALAEATVRFEHELSEEAYAEQQRLLKRKLEFDARLRQMASERAATPSGEAPTTTAE